MDVYKDFYINYLMKIRFHYYFDDGSDFIVEFQDWAFYHLLGIQHIDSSITKNDFISKINNGLQFSNFKSNKKIRKRFNDQKERIAMFSCVHSVLKYARVFYCPNRVVLNTKNVSMDYILYREIDNIGFNLGIREENSCQVPLTILIDRQNQKEKHIDKSNIKNVSKLVISEKSSGNIIEQLVYSNSFIVNI